MARVTVEDCLANVDNRFQLVMMATKRARQLASGQQPMVDWENDKPTVVALREIAEGKVDVTILDKPDIEEESAETRSMVTEEELGQLRQGIIVDTTEGLGQLRQGDEE